MLEDRPRRRGGGGATLPAPFEPPAGHEHVVDRIRGYERVRTYLLPALIDAQHELGWLPPWVVEFIGVHLRVPKSEVYGIASSFPDLKVTEPTHTSRVCRGASCRQRGAQPDANGEGLADCLFVCGVGPVIEVDGEPKGTPRTPGAIPAGALLQDGTCTRAVFDTSNARDTQRVGCAGNCWQAPAWSTDGGTTWQSADATWVRPETDRLLAHIGRQEPLAERPYDALDKALGMGSDAVWQLVKESGLRGRGGAYFPVGAKWETARDTQASRKFLLVNAEEGEPGIYKDRHLLEGDPHRVLEGIQIAALGIGATNVVIFVNGEAHVGRERLLAALQTARTLGAIRVPTEVRLGGGGYVLGEETALINAIHGMRAEPLARPPFPAVSGLLASPTVINNVESLTNLPDIVRFGSEWFRSVGSEQTPGTKLVSLAGAVNRPGLYEVALGTTLRTIVDSFGGGVTGALGAVLIGGPSGSILPPSMLDTALDVAPLQAVGGVLGAAGIVPLTEDQCPIHAVRELVAYNARESCGKCTPCREGTPRMLHFFDDLRQADLDLINELNDVLAFGSLCGLGQMAPNPVRALLRHFADVVSEHTRGHCRTGTCQWS